ncbi:MAG: hypothetical protein CMD22_04405 [Flavobacteriales bacterium]|nr:hypothetical protein [Flavobacteriales bacterium]|tara:strand:- start:130 stop:1779 length:1650 start_codon:yes stop_codon:yes gene_type:complete
MKNCILILLYFSSIVSYSQVTFSSSSSNTYYKEIDGKRISFTIIKSNENGKENQRCVLNNFIDVDCELVSDCFNKNECGEIREILKKEEKEQTQHNIKNIDKSEVFINLKTNKSEIYVGEQISSVSEIYIKNGVNIQNTNIQPISYDGFWEDEVKVNSNKRKRKIIDGINYTTIKFRHSVLTSQKSGLLIIPPTNMEIDIPRKGRLIQNHPFFGPQYETVLTTQNIKTKEKQIRVKELPKPIPKNFYGTVSKKFSIRSEIDRTNLKTSEAISFKVIFRGEGNINMLVPFEINFPNSFEVFDPIITDKTYIGNHNTGGTKIFEYILIPREKGNYTIPNVSFSYFNPQTKEYSTINSKSYDILVEQGKKYTPTDTLNLPYEELSLLQNSSFSKISFRKMLHSYFYTVFWSISCIIILLILTSIILNNRKINPIDQKRRKSTKIAIRRLKNAQLCINNNNFDMFFEEIEKALWGYFADKFNVSHSQLSKETIEYYFKRNNIEIDLQNNFIELLNKCEFARYAPDNNKNKQMQNTLNSAKEIIIEVESNLKRK